MHQRRAQQRVVDERITYLFTLAKEQFGQDQELSRRAIAQLRRVAMKHTRTITSYKRQFCLACNTLIVPGVSAQVRIHHNRRVITCLHCGKIKRLGLSKLRTS